MIRDKTLPNSGLGTPCEQQGGIARTSRTYAKNAQLFRESRQLRRWHRRSKQITLVQIVEKLLSRCYALVHTGSRDPRQRRETQQSLERTGMLRDLYRGEQSGNEGRENA